MRCFLNLFVPLMTLVPLCGITALAQTPTYGNLGRTPSIEEIRAWDIAISPEGKELPPGSGTAQQGAVIYAQKCAACHGATGTEGPNNRLVGGKDTLKTPAPVKTLGSLWPFATTIWDFINRAMPADKPGSLSADQVYAVTAFLLYRNGIIQESDVLNAQNLPSIQMPNRDGFVPRVQDIRRWRCPIGTCP